MNPKTGIPEIKPEVNKEKGKDRQKAGFFARLFGAGDAGGSLAGSAIDIGGAAAGGGLLATKAGLIALLLAGSTVAAGIGLVGYRMFGPGQDSSDNNYTLFAPKPKPAPTAPAVAPGSQDGTSQSLSMLNKANVDEAAKAGAGDAALKDQTAADASAATASGGANVANTAMSDSGPSASKTIRAANLPPLAGFGSSGGMPSGGAAGTSGPPAKYDPAKSGVMGSMASKGTPGASRTAATAGAHAGRSNGALGQAFGALSNQAGGRAGSSYAAGRTYDSSTASAAGPSAGAPSAGGPGDAGSQAAAKSTPNTARTSNQIQPPPTPPATNVTPWQGDIDAARALVATALVLMILLTMLKRMERKTIKNPWMHAAKMIIGAIMAAIGLAVIALGARISGGPWAQTLQGHVLAAAGAGIIVASLGSFLEDSDGPKTTDTGTGTPATSSSATVSPSNGAPVIKTAVSAPAGGAAAGGVGGMLGSAGTFLIIGGGIALLGLAASALMPPKKDPSTEFNNGLPPGQGWFSRIEAPSDRALERYLSRSV